MSEKIHIQDLLKLLDNHPQKFDRKLANLIKKATKRVLDDPSFALELAIGYKLAKRGYGFATRYPEYIHELAYILSNIDGNFSRDVRNAVYCMVRDLLANDEDVLNLLCRDKTVSFLNKLARSLSE